MKSLRSLDLRIATWLVATALTGAVLGTMVEPAGSTQDRRITRTQSVRYARNTTRNLRLQLRRRGGR